MTSLPAARDAGLASQLRLSVMRLRRRLAAEHHPDNELSIGAMSVLGALHRSGTLSIGDLAQYERVQPPSMTRTVNGLEAGGYVSRERHELDGRQVLVRITDAGRAVLLADRARRDAWLDQRLRRLTPEERAVLRRAVPLLDALAQQD